MANNRVNPLTGKRRDWEEAEAQRKAEQVDTADIEKRLGLLKRAQMAQTARSRFMPFIKFTSPDPEDPNDVEKSKYENARHHDALARVIEEVVEGNIRFLILTMPPRHGKEIADSTPVLTPTGWTTHGELVVGDQVFGVDGKPTTVLAVAAPNTEKVEVELTNGARIKCHPNHEWTVYDRSRRKWLTLETCALMARQLWNGPVGKRGGRATFQLPSQPCVEFGERQLPMAPYALGVWLGDGCTGTGRIDMAASDDAVWRRVEALGYQVNSQGAHADTGVIRTHFGTGKTGTRGPFTEALFQAGVLNRKHIPQEFLLSSKAQRMELLAGLMDTDGCVDAPTGRCKFTSTEPEMVDGVVELCRSLGYRTGVTMQEPALSSSGIQGRKRVYTVAFQPTELLTTSLLRRQNHRLAKQRAIGIKSITPCAPELGRCIQVDREDGLYLVGRELVPTHNSEQVSRKLPAWFMGRFPHQHGVVATYSDDFAGGFGKDVRGIVKSSQFKQVFPGVSLIRGGSASDELITTQGGKWRFVGRGGGLTGGGAHILICDDLIKDDKEAMSPAIRDQAWAWFTRVAMTRRMGMKLVVMTFTRWHADDPIGRLTDPENPYYNEKFAKKIKIINLPAIAEDDDPLGRKPGEALWPDGPDKFGLDFLEEQQMLDPLGFAALYQQRPSLLEGDLFKRENIRFYGPGTENALPEDLRFYASSDHAVGTNQRNDPSCFLKVGIDRNNDIYLIDCDWRKMASDVATEAMLAMASGNMKPLQWWAEKGHISKSIGPFLRKRMLETGTYINLIEVTPVVDKVQRAQSIAARVATGKVFFPKNALWTEKALNELMAFPNGTRDDFVDAFAWIGLGLQNQFGPGKKSVKKEPPPFGTLAWVKLAEKWADEKKARVAAGGF